MTKDVKDHYSCWKQFCLGKYIMCQGGLCPLFWWGSWVPSNTVAWAEAYLRTKWHLNPSSRWATIGMGWKLGACAPLWEDELGPHLTQYGHAEAYLMPIFILIHPTVWPQYTNVSDRTNRDRTGQWSDGIERTVLQTVAHQDRQRNTMNKVKKNWKTIITGN